MLHGPELDELPLTGRWLVVSFHRIGAGELPDNLQPLLEQLAEQQPDLSEVQFGAVGLAVPEYDTFCGAIKQIDDLLIARGTLKRIGDRLEIDVTEREIPRIRPRNRVKNLINLLYFVSKDRANDCG